MEKRIPVFLVNKINEQYDEENAKKIFNGLIKDKKTTFRINRIKTNLQDVEDVLNENNILYSKVDFLEDALILDNGLENKIRELDIYKNGKIYLQSLSSMLPVIYLEPKEKENILDMCAAPRWKNISNFKCYK